ncbi:Centrosome-associated zinc finger protein CP190 [Papilio machaon]|uniref:Centrosome-associated zinc finger protein CP190 n=1 Tax=Papilio machaon TaxID=76193 RepID=A0A194RIM5_PAPMA|nr:Centrosome-associated zinc finger protein CP190 [Papilio machaon]
MSDMKQVKVDNWGIYFLQRLKHFFNRTDYCDLTLQFQDNAQLKVHRLVLNACTEYFELLERTCEMYEDCLVMPDDLQADVVVPIVNFMYTGQLGFKPELLERLYQTAQVMNMPVLTKLLDAHRNQMQRTGHDYQNLRSYSKSFESSKQSKSPAVASTSYTSTKRSYSKAFDNAFPTKLDQNLPNNESSYSQKESTEYPVKKKPSIAESRPTRYELPEELDGDNIFDNSFTSISYESTPLMVHPETVKRYSSKKTNIFDETSSTKRLLHGTSTLDIVECKKLSTNENIFDDVSENVQDDAFSSDVSTRQQKDSNQLFDLILDNDNSKATIEIKDSETSKKPKIDHAKIISDVLKKYPHLVKSNKNIKLRVLDAPIKSKKSKSASFYHDEKDVKPKHEQDWTLDIDVLDSKGAAKLIAMGVDNVKGPWICLICGTPGRALHFGSYYKFRRHLIEVHNEKPVVNMCEYCGLKSHKRNYLLHHLYTKHGVPPPSPYYFPKCNQCPYIALSEALLVKHKSTQHDDSKTFACNVCAATFSSSTRLLTHIQMTGHKYSADRRTILHCIYCYKTFSRETNLYSHLKYNHKQSAQTDKIIEESDDEKEYKRPTSGKSDKTKNISLTYTNEYENIDVKYQIQQKPDGNIQVLSKLPQSPSSSKHKILNPSFNSPNKSAQKSELSLTNKTKPEICEVKPSKIINKEDEIVVINGNEYIIKENHLIPRSQNAPENEEYILGNDTEQSENNSVPTTSMEFPIIQHTNTEDSKMIIKKPIHVNEPIEIVVSSEEQYKALMSSTHSIIFEEPNKTLTVLTAPQTSTIEGTTIDLDNTQTNDMMIIQENYPLNVSETVSTDNNNIVVVYSHQVDDSSKQFQYIPTQGIEAQFIQSSAMVTQNYGTVTTSTPVMSVHTLDTNVNESWQNTLKESVESVPIQVKLQQHVEVNDSDSQQLIGDPQNSSDVQSTQDIPISEDPSVVSTDLDTIDETTAQTCLENTNNSETVSMDQVLIDEAPSMPTTNVPISEPSEQLVHKEIQTESIDIVCSNQLDVPENNVKNINNGQLGIVADKCNENIIVLQQKVVELDINRDVNTTIVQDASVIQQNLITEEAALNSGSSSVEVPTNNIEVKPTQSDKELPDLTTEWTPVDKENLIADNVDTNITGGSAYIEESIENIQQEMAKQLEAITTENKTMQNSEPITTSTTNQPEMENESVIKELEIQKHSSTLGLDDSEISPDETNAKLLVSQTKDKGISESLSTTIVEPASTDIRGKLSNITDKVETTSEKNIQDNMVTAAESEINTADVNDPKDEPVSPENKEIVNHDKEDKAEEKTSLIEENHTKPQQRPVISLNNKAREKINTILNDWDDNDDQDEKEDDLKNESEFIVAKNNDEIVQEVEMIPEVNAAQEAIETPPVKVAEISNEKIKSIVSDWDDDDDEEESK